MTKSVVFHSGGQRYVAFVDDEDYGLVAEYKWFAKIKLWSSTTYALASIPGTTIQMHTLILGKRDGLEIDHINRNGLDNRKTNLRFCTHADNLRNEGPRGLNIYKGVSYMKHNNKWRARITTSEGRKHLGVFATAKEAALAYNEAAKATGNPHEYLNNVGHDK